MRKFDGLGECLCRQQAAFFALSLQKSSLSSPQFIRYFLTSDFAVEADRNGDDDRLSLFFKAGSPLDSKEILYSEDELYWLGYLYRYICYTRILTSAQLFRAMPSKELRPYYSVYHTQDMERSAALLLEKFPVFPQDPLAVIRDVFSKKEPRV